MAVEFDCFHLFLSTLQHLLVIPSYDALGKSMWTKVEDLVHTVTVQHHPHLDVEEIVTIDKLKTLVGWKERLEELSQENAEKESSLDTLKSTIAELETKLEAATKQKPLQSKAKEDIGLATLQPQSVGQTVIQSRSALARSNSRLPTPQLRA